MRKKVIALIRDDYDKGKITESQMNIYIEEVRTVEKVKKMTAAVRKYHRRMYNKKYYNKNVEQLRESARLRYRKKDEDGILI